MIVSALITKIRDAITSSAEISAWATTNFAKSLRVDVGFDSTKPPAATTYPLAAIAGRRYTAALTDPRAEIELDIYIALSCSTITIDTHGQILKGTVLLTELRELITRAAMVGTKAKITSPQQESEWRVEPPLFAEIFVLSLEVRADNRKGILS